MSNRWVVDNEYPSGHLVPMTTAEQEQLDATQATGLAAAILQDSRNTNQAMIIAAASLRMATLRQARTALSGGAIFSGLSTNERKVIDLLLQNDLQFGRLVLQAFDATDA